MNIDYDDFENRVDTTKERRKEYGKPDFGTAVICIVLVFAVMAFFMCIVIQTIEDSKSKTYTVTKNNTINVVALEKATTIDNAQVLKADVERQGNASMYYLYLLVNNEIVKTSVNLETYALANSGDIINLIIRRDIIDKRAEAFFDTIVIDNDTESVVTLDNYVILNVVATEDECTVTIGYIENNDEVVTLYCEEPAVSSLLRKGIVVDCRAVSVNGKYLLSELECKYYMSVN